MTLDKQKIKVNRGVIKRTFQSKGLPYVSELILLNLDDTLKILKWNVQNDILLYRMSSDSFPWMSEYNFSDLPNFDKIKFGFMQIGQYLPLFQTSPHSKTQNQSKSYRCNNRLIPCGLQSS